MARKRECLFCGKVMLRKNIRSHIETFHSTTPVDKPLIFCGRKGCHYRTKRGERDLRRHRKSKFCPYQPKESVPPPEVGAPSLSSDAATLKQDQTSPIQTFPVSPVHPTRVQGMEEGEPEGHMTVQEDEDLATAYAAAAAKFEPSMGTPMDTATSTYLEDLPSTFSLAPISTPPALDTNTPRPHFSGGSPVLLPSVGEVAHYLRTEEHRQLVNAELEPYGLEVRQKPSVQHFGQQTETSVTTFDFPG